MKVQIHTFLHVWQYQLWSRRSYSGGVLAVPSGLWVAPVSADVVLGDNETKCTQRPSEKSSESQNETHLCQSQSVVQAEQQLALSQRARDANEELSQTDRAVSKVRQWAVQDTLIFQDAEQLIAVLHRGNKPCQLKQPCESLRPTR